MPRRNSSDRRGFASMDDDKQKRIASLGGKAAHASGHAHEFSREEAQSAGRKGGMTVSQNKNHMAEIGARGGKAVSQNRQHMAEIGARGGHTRGRRGQQQQAS